MEVINLNEKQIDADSIYMQSVFDKVYPVGAIYMSVNSTSPATLFGGTWTQLKDRFLVGAGNSYAVNATGGSTSHSHKYGMQLGGYYNETALAESGNAGLLNYNTSNGYSLSGYSSVGSKTVNINNSVTAATKSTGMNHYVYIANTSYTDSTPPYLAVYMWQRTA